MISRKLPYLGVLPGILALVTLPVVTSCGDDSSTNTETPGADAGAPDGAVAQTSGATTTTESKPATDEHSTQPRDASADDTEQTTGDVTSSITNTPDSATQVSVDATSDAGSPLETTVMAVDASSTPALSSDVTSSDATLTANPADGGTGDAGATTGEDTTDPCHAGAPDTARGTFVSQDGSDVEDCGSAEAPCQTISLAIAHAVSNSKDTVYIARGTYAEQLTLHTSVSLFGGYTVDSGVWNRACNYLADTTLVKSPTSIGLLADFSGVAQVRGLTLMTKDRDASPDSESRYGVFASGANTRLTFADVAIRAGDANHGHVGDPGETLASAVCDAGYGQDGVAAEPTPTTSPGAFSEYGFVAGTGATGYPGNLGQGGAGGTPVSYNCASCNIEQQCISWGYYGGCYQYADVCALSSYAYQTAPGGANGCGGAPGSGGVGGGGGGASIGIFAWQAKIELSDDLVVFTSDGGDGAQGGSGGQGAAGTAGSAGTVVACNPGMGCSSAPCSDQFQGGTGGSGGAGSNGGAGGTGAGGWSIALAGTPGAFTGANKALTLTGDAGDSPDEGLVGVSQPIYVIQ